MCPKLNGEKISTFETDRKGQKRPEADRNGQKQTEMDRNRQKRTDIKY